MKRIISILILLFAPFITAHAQTTSCQVGQLATANAAMKKANEALAKSIKLLKENNSFAIGSAKTWLGVDSQSARTELIARLAKILSATNSVGFTCSNLTTKKTTHYTLQFFQITLQKRN